LLHLDSRFSLSRSAEQLFAFNAGRSASRLFSQALRLLGQAFIQWRGLFYTASLLHGATPHTRADGLGGDDEPYASVGGEVSSLVHTAHLPR
jgi:hypothetical protein